MRKSIKNYVIMACLAAGLTAGFTGVSAVNVMAAESDRLAMAEGASLYLGEGISGLKFTYNIADYNAETDNGNYGMLIVPYDYLALAGITDLTDTSVDYIAQLEEAFASEEIKYAPIVKEGLTPDENGKVEYSIGELFENNYVRQFFGIGFEKIGDSYSYAVQNDNVRSVFEVANIAVNAINFEGLTSTEIDWKAIEASVLNPYLETGYKFVCGDNAPEISFDMTYAGAESGEAKVTLTKVSGKEGVELPIRWHYSIDKNDTIAELTENDTVKGLSRGQTTVTAQVGSLAKLTVEAMASVLKDATEYQIYQNSTDADFFAAEEAANDKAYSTVRLDGGYWNTDSNDKITEKTSGYIALKNPNSEDGKYTISSQKTLWMDFYFTGNNMPNVEFFGTTLEGVSLTNGGTTGYVFNNGVSRTDTYYEYTQTVLPSYNAETGTYDTTNWKNGSNTFKYAGIVGSPFFFRYGMSGYGKFSPSKYGGKYSTYYANSYALDKENESSGYNIMQYASSNWSNSAISFGSKFSMYELMKDETKQWHYKIGMKVSSKYARFWAYLYSVDEDGTETLHIKKENAAGDNATGYSERSGYIIVHGALKGSLTECKAAGNADYYYSKFAYSLPYSK